MRVRKKVNLIMLSRWSVGGSKSFTVQAAKALQSVGVEARILRPCKYKTERETEVFGYPATMVPYKDLKQYVEADPSLITACAPSNDLPEAHYTERLLQAGARIAVYDPNEYKIYPHMPYVNNWIKSPLIIRKTMKKFFPKGVLIRNPYWPVFDEATTHKKTVHAVSIARTASVKNSDVIIKANYAIKQKKKRVVLHGAEDRLFSYNMRGKGFDVDVTPMDKSLDAGAYICSYAQFAVDLTVFKDDGGEQQYSFLQAIDGGAINIIHKDWASAGTMWKDGENCFTVSSPEELAHILLTPHPQHILDHILHESKKILNLCSPAKTGKQLRRFLL